MSAPGQQSMDDIFRGQDKVMVKQEFAVMECCGCEAKNRYRVTVPNGEEEGPEVFLYVDEDSGCVERLCCSVNRSLTLNVHQGDNKEGKTVLSMHKPFHCQGGCFCRPTMQVFDGEKDSTLVGHIEDPCRCCMMDQQIYDETGKLIFTTYGSICQLGMCCPMCASVDFEIKQDDKKVGLISKRPMTCGECLGKTNRFIIEFPMEKKANERKMIFAAAMLADLEYFEQKKNKNDS
mmetsp:Transcript_45473/g.75538  ORF Transcript_45473/g.75538 Transcript_45473/m.75538 type:complete len:234 (+) Transcript_45473:75-776(+)